MSLAETKHWGEVEGVSIDFPMEVTAFHSATFTWTVPIEPAREILPGDGFEVADMGDGTTMLILALCDYRENPWGDYDEVNFGLLVHPTGRPEEVGAFQWRMPVNQRMTAAAGREVLGLPKTVEELEFRYTDEAVEVELAMGGKPTLVARFPRAEPAGEPTADRSLTYSYVDGVPTLVPLTIELPTGMVDPAQVEIELGTSAAAAELRSLGLPRAPEMAMWGEDLRGTFEWPTPI